MKRRMILLCLMAILLFPLVGCGKEEIKEETETAIETQEEAEKEEEIPLAQTETPKEIEEKPEISKEQVVDFIAMKLKTPIVWDANVVSVFDGIPYTYDCTYYYDGKRLRMDIWGPSGEQHFIQDEEAGTAYLLDLVRNRALPIVGEQLIQGMYFYNELYNLEIDPNSEEAKVHYDERNGKPVFEISYTPEVGELITALVDAESGLPYQYSVSYYGTPQVEIESSNIRLNETLEGNLFELPEGIEIVDIDKWVEAE